MVAVTRTALQRLAAERLIMWGVDKAVATPDASLPPLRQLQLRQRLAKQQGGFVHAW